MERRQLRGGSFSHIGDGKCKKPARKRRRLRLLNRLHRLGRVLFTEDSGSFIRSEVERSKLRNCELENVKWFAHESALHQFVSYDPAYAFYVECAARGKKF